MKKREEKKGIYKIECIVSGRIYVGSTCVDFKKRWKKHKQRLRNNYHENDYLQKAWNKYGEDNFVFSIIEEQYDDAEIKLREEYWLKIYFSMGKEHCFNLSDKVCGGNTLLTDDIRKKQSDGIKKSYTPELLEKRRVFANNHLDDF
jgi:group I intron endonuclease